MSNYELKIVYQELQASTINSYSFIMDSYDKSKIEILLVKEFTANLSFSRLKCTTPFGIEIGYYAQYSSFRTKIF